MFKETIGKSRRRKLEMDCDESCSESEVDSPENIQLSRTKQNPHKKEKNSGENGIGSDESDCDSCDGCSENDDSRIVSECPGSGGSNIDQCESDGDEGSRGVSDDSIEESKNADLDFERSSRWHCLSCTYLNSYPSRLCEMCGYALCLSIIIQPSQCSVCRRQNHSHHITAVSGTDTRVKSSKGRLALPRRKGIIRK